MSEEVDFITTIADLKKYVASAEAARDKLNVGEFRFKLHKPLRNTGGEGGFGQHEESFELFIGEINLNRERLKREETEVFELKLSDIFKAVGEARKRKCDKVTLQAVSKFTEEEDSGLMNVCITEIENLTEKWLGATKEEAPVLSNEAGEIKEVGKTKFTPIEDETIEACCGTLSEEMREHLEMYHPPRDLRRLECPRCGMYFQMLHFPSNVCHKCYLESLSNETKTNT